MEMSSEADSDSEVEWEDVEPLKEQQASSGQALEIVLPTDGSFVQGKRKSKQNLLDKAIAAFNRELQQNIHKVHLLCLLAHGIQMSSSCDDPLLQSVLLSLLPKELTAGGSEMLASYKVLLNLLKWLKSEKSQVLEKVGKSSPSDGPSLTPVQLLVALLRSLGLRVRLVLVLSPASFKPSRAKNKERKTGKTGSPSTKGKSPLRRSASKSTSASVSATSGLEGVEPGDPGGSVVGDLEGDSMVFGTSSDCPAARGEPKRTPTAVSRRKTRSRAIHSDSSPNEDSCQHNSPSADFSPRPWAADVAVSTTRGGRRASKITSTTACKNSPYFRPGRKRRRRGRKDGSESCSGEEVSNSDGDSDYNPSPEKLNLCKKLMGRTREDSEKRHGDSEDKVRPKKCKNEGREEGSVCSRAKRRRLAEEGDQELQTSDVTPDEEGEQKEEVKSNQSLYDETTSWVEVYVQPKQQWTCLHVPSSSVGQPQLCEKDCSASLSYVIGVESAHRVCDVSARYTSWCTQVRKQRLSEEWWVGEVLRPFSPGEEEVQQEKEDILTILYSHPLPASISEYKSHPLYALKRHLLKFQAIYPEESQILGYCRGEPVYARECVHVLHTRETWLKEGRVVRRGEVPYKAVKARKKKGQGVLENKTVEVFGRWQTEEYMAPPVVDGKVPRNEYGNIELFQPSMLPPGAAHLTLPGIQRVARKLEIDFSPAMMGWEFHGGYCHPILDGVVVAQESESLLREAWQQEQQITMEKEAKKREKRVVERWRTLTRGLLIRERVRRRYLDSAC